MSWAPALRYPSADFLAGGGGVEERAESALPTIRGKIYNRSFLSIKPARPPLSIVHKGNRLHYAVFANI